MLSDAALAFRAHQESENGKAGHNPAHDPPEIP
jgi:hypothetical protein